MNKEKLKDLMNRIKAEAPGKLEQGKKLALAGVRWMKANKAITIAAAVAVFFVFTQLRECVVRYQVDAQIARANAEVRERQKQQEERQKQQEEQRKRDLATSELFRLLGGKYKNEDNLENRKALKRIRELIEIVGVDVKNSDSESLLFYAYKNGLQKNFVAVLTEAGASLSEDEAFEVNRLAEVAKKAAIEAFLKNPKSETALKKCVEYGVDFQELDKDEKKSLIFKTLYFNTYNSDASCAYFRPTEATELLAQQGLKFRPEEKAMVVDAWARKFWRDFNLVIEAQGYYRENQIDPWRKEIFPDAKRLGAIGIDVLSVLNSQSKFDTGVSFLYLNFKSDGKIENKRYPSDEVAKNTPLFLIELKKNEMKVKGLVRKEERGRFQQEVRGNDKFPLDLDEVASLLKDFGAALTSDEVAYLKKQSDELKAGAKEYLWERVSDRSLSTEQLSRILDVVGDLNGLYDNREVSILHNAYSWDISVFEDSHAASFVLKNGSGAQSVMNVRASSRYPLPSEQVELLKKHGATFKDGELQRLKYNATVWLKKYFLSTITPLRDVDNIDTGLYMNDVARIRRVYPLYKWGNAKDFLPTITEFAENEIIEGVEYPSCLNEWAKIFEEESEQGEKSRLEKSGFRQSYVVGVGKLREVQKMTGLKGNFSDLIDGNQNKHSLLFIAWDKSFSDEFTDLLTARGFKYLDGEIELMRAVTRAKATRLLFILLQREETKTKNPEQIFKIKNLCKDLISDGADVNATLDGQSVLQIAQMNELAEALIQTLQEAGAK